LAVNDRIIIEVGHGRPSLKELTVVNKMTHEKAMEWVKKFDE